MIIIKMTSLFIYRKLTINISKLVIMKMTVIPCYSNGHRTLWFVGHNENYQQVFAISLGHFHYDMLVIIIFTQFYVLSSILVFIMTRWSYACWLGGHQFVNVLKFMFFDVTYNYSTLLPLMHVKYRRLVPDGEITRAKINTFVNIKETCKNLRNWLSPR